MATICGAVNFSMSRLVCRKVNTMLLSSSLSSSNNGRVKLPGLNRPWRRNVPSCVRGRLSLVRAAGAEILSEKVEKSVVEAKEVCSDDPESGECVAAWDEVEELSAAASHARDREKETLSLDPLEIYCKDNPETDECRIYDN